MSHFVLSGVMSGTDDMDRDLEVTLVRQLRAGDARAFDQIYEIFNRRLLNFQIRMTRNRASAEDLLEETWLRLVTSGSNLDADTRLRNWLFTVARNLFLSHCRSRSRENSYTGENSLFWPELTSRSPHDEAYLSEFGDRIERALAELPPSYREALSRKMTEELRTMTGVWLLCDCFRNSRKTSIPSILGRFRSSKRISGHGGPLGFPIRSTNSMA